MSARNALLTLAFAALFAPLECRTDHSGAGAAAAGTVQPDSDLFDEEVGADATAPLPPPPLVLAVRTLADGSGWLHPLAWWSNARGAPGAIFLANDSGFADHHFQKGTRYRLYSSGADVGSATVDTAWSCGFIQATFALRPGVSPAIVHIATNARGGWSTPLHRRPLTHLEQERAYLAAAESLRSHQVPAALWGAPDSLDGAVFTGVPPDTAVVVAAMHTGASDSAGDRLISLLLVADVVGDSMRVTYGRLFDGYDADVRADYLLDGLHLRHGAWPELLIESTYYDYGSVDYTALHRQGGRWVPWFRGAAGGC